MELWISFRQQRNLESNPSLAVKSMLLTKVDTIETHQKNPPFDSARKNNADIKPSKTDY